LGSAINWKGRAVNFSPPLSSFSLRFSSSALTDAPKLYQRSYREFPAVSPVAYSSDEILVRQPLACRCVGEARKAERRVSSHITLVEAEGELVNVPAKMLEVDVMEYDVDTALGRAVIDGFMGIPGKAAISRKFIGMKPRSRFDVQADHVMDNIAVGTFDRHGDNEARKGIATDWTQYLTAASHACRGQRCRV
jgi:hypothetical protein